MILEGRPDIGGTWDLFRYPGVRSDSDMHTLGYSFKPWTGDKSIAEGPAILDYLKETIEEYDLARHITLAEACAVPRGRAPSSAGQSRLNTPTPASAAR